jgi:hypothetical protein
MAKPTENHELQNVIAFRNGDRAVVLARLLRGKIQTRWKATGDTLEMSRVLLDEAYRQLFDEFVGLTQHRETVAACMIHQRQPPHSDQPQNTAIGSR